MKVNLADQNSTKSQQDVLNALEKIQGNLEQLLKDARDELSKISMSKDKIDEKDKDILK